MAKGGGNELSELVVQMQGTVTGHFKPLLEGLGHTWTTEGEHVAGLIDRLRDACNRSEHELDAAFTKAAGVLKDGDASAKTEAAHTVDALHAYQAHLHESGGKVQELVGNVITHSGDLGEKLQHAMEINTATHDQVAAHYADWHGNVDQMLGNLASHQSQLVEGLHSLADTTHGHITDLGNKLQHAGEVVTQHVGSLVQTHQQHSEELANNQKEHLLQTIAEAVGGKNNELVGHLGDFVGVAEQAGQVFDGALGGVLNGVDEVMGLVHSIEPVLKLAEELA